MKRQSLAQEIADGIKSLTETLETGTPVSENFSCSRVTLSLQPSDYDAERVKATRNLLDVDRSIFAAFLGEPLETIKSWETGAAVPCGSARRILDEISLAPQYWSQRLQGCITVTEMKPKS
jgi:DNA-binding transcriptional regulator YiaG